MSATTKARALARRLMHRLTPKRKARSLRRYGLICEPLENRVLLSTGNDFCEGLTYSGCTTITNDRPYDLSGTTLNTGQSCLSAEETVGYLNFSGTIIGGGSLIKTGTGLLNLTGIPSINEPDVVAGIINGISIAQENTLSVYASNSTGGVVYITNQQGVTITNNVLEPELHQVTVTAPWDRVDGDTSSINALIVKPGLDNEISLREAIMAANNTEGADEIVFWQYLKGLSLQVLSDLQVTDTLTITGHGQEDMFLSADGIHAFFNVDMTNSPGGSFTLNDITLQGEAEYAVLAHPGDITLNDVTIRLEGEPEDDTYVSSSYWNLGTITFNSTEDEFEIQPIIPNTGSTTIEADKITISKLTGIDMELAIKATGHIQIDSITNIGNDLTIEGDSITATGTVSTTPPYNSDYRDAGDITFTSHNGLITVHEVIANAGGRNGGSSVIIPADYTYLFIVEHDLAVTYTDLFSSEYVIINDSGFNGSNGGDITFQTTKSSWDGPLVYIEGDGLISADGQNVFIGTGGLSGTITIEHEVASLGSATLTVSSEPGDNYQGIAAGGIWDDVDEDPDKLRDLVKQYGGIIIGQFVMKPGELKLNEQVLQDGFGTMTIAGNGSLTLGGMNDSFGLTMTSGGDWWRPVPTRDHSLTANATIDDQGRLVYTFSPSKLEGTSKTYQILTQPDEGTISFVDGQFVFYPENQFNIPAGEISFKYRIIYGNGKTSNRSTITMNMQDISTFEGYNTTAPIGAPNLVRTYSNSAIDINVLRNDHDPDGDQLITSGVDIVSELGIVLSINDDGTIRYDPTVGFVAFEPGLKVRDQFCYTVSDPFGNHDTVRVFVDVTGVSEPVVSVASVQDVPFLQTKSRLPVLVHDTAGPRGISVSTVQAMPRLSLRSLLSQLGNDEDKVDRLRLMLVDA